MADESIVELAKERYQRAKDANSTLEQQAIADTKFVLGDSDNLWQWPQEVYDKRATGQGKPCLTINITAQHCNQIENQIRQNRPSGKVLAVDSKADPKTAEVLGGLLRSIQSYSNADTAHDIGAMHSIYGGIGYWRVLTDYESEDSFDQVVTIKPLVNPRLVYIDPDAIEPDRSDAKWGFIFEDVPISEAQRDHEDVNVSSWAEDSDMGWVTKDTVRRAEYFWCEEESDTLLLLDSGATALQSELAAAGAKVKGDVVSDEAGTPVALIVKRRKTCRNRWYWCKLLGGHDQPLDKKDWPGSYLPIITVVGKEVNVNGEIVRKGVVRDLKDSGRMTNYSYSAAVETVALQNKVPYLAAAEAVEGFEDIWGAANIENRAYLPWNAFDENGQALPKPERQQPASMATAQVQMLQLSVEQMRASSGQQNANFGIKSEAQSGVGIQRLKAQGEIATFHFPDNLARALKYEAKVVLDLIPKIYDSKRIVRILGLDGEDSEAIIDPEMETAHQDSPDKNVAAIFNPNVGRYDVTIDTGPSYQTQRQESADTLTELTGRNPQLMAVAGDLVMKSYDFPLAQEMSERLKKTLPPNLQDDDGDQAAQLQGELQQVSGQLQQAGQAIEAMQQHIEQLEMEKKAGFGKNETAIKTALIQHETDMVQQEDEHNVARYKAQTERMAALAPAFGPEEVQALVLQTLQQVLGAPPIDGGPPTPPAMGVTGTQPGLASPPSLPEGTPNV